VGHRSRRCSCSSSPTQWSSAHRSPARCSAACDATFNAATVDGDTSTNDSVLALASGASGIAPPADALLAALTEVCDTLARSMVRDGEGPATSPS
jgi:glutamate N-acetyltransferase/amino-acid N-acetyltransferase